ncbi:MAG: LarC family nickel insertion protein [Nitrospira sp.]|nr:LarC family nickel insertion protein [Nitrospira sp.]
MALLRTLASEFGSNAVIETAVVGYGAGDRDPEGWPNALRVFLSEESPRAGRLTDHVMQIETNLDDLNPQTYEHVMERLFAVGAVDVVLIPAIMKRSRPGVVLSCLVARDRADAVLDVIFQETTALGVRVQEVARRILPRRFVSVKVLGGVVRIKIAAIGAGWEKAAPEYIDCKNIADRTGRPLKNVMETASRAYDGMQAKRHRSS